MCVGWVGCLMCVLVMIVSYDVISLLHYVGFGLLGVFGLFVWLWVCLVVVCFWVVFVVVSLVVFDCLFGVF